MLKKLLSAVLAALLTATCFAGCKGKADTSKEVTLKWILFNAQQKDSELVQEEFNKQLKSLLPNTKVEIVYETALGSKWSMLMAAKEEYDIAWTGYTLDMNEAVNSGTYMKLNDLVNDYGPNIQKEQKTYAAAYKTGMKDNELYAIPNEQPILHQSSYFRIPAEFIEYFPKDEFLDECHANYKTTEKTYQLLESYFSKVKASGKVTNGQITIDPLNFFLAVVTRGYDFVGTSKGGAWLCYDTRDKSGKIVSFMQTDAYKLYIKYAASWVEKGYIAEDYLLGASGYTEIGTCNVTEMWYGLDEEKGVRYMKDDSGNIKYYQFLTDTTETMFNGANIFGSEKTYTVIPFTSKNPERAMMLIDLLRSEKGKDLLNLLIYGIEGKHYDLDGDCAKGKDYTIQPSSTSVYGIPHWVVGNVFLCYRTPNILEGQKEWAQDFIENVQPKLYSTALKGFRADTTAMTLQISQVNRALSEYHQTLIAGSLGSNYNASYDAMIKKMKEAGLDELLSKMNEQAKEYMSKN